MVRISRISLIFLVTIVLTAACSSPSERPGTQNNTNAYVLHEGEFNRTSPTFSKDPTNIDSVTICYNKYGTKPSIVANMAVEECAKFNKKAEFVRQSLSVCPLFTPVAAIYNCVGGN